MAVLRQLIILTAFLLSGCAIQRTPSVTKIALLAPFEGQYREIGYEALYAARLALADVNSLRFDLLAIDDGGSIETATLRAEGIARDPSIAGVMLLGVHAVSADVQRGLGDLPTLVVGHWNTTPTTETVYLLSSEELDEFINFDGNLSNLVNTSSVVGSEVLSLEQVPQLVEDTSAIEIVSSSQLPNSEFRERYLDSAQFVPEPRLIAPLVYDATAVLLEAIISNQQLSEITYNGINGIIEFEAGYWRDAPINRFRYADDQLVSLQ